MFIIWIQHAQSTFITCIIISIITLLTKIFHQVVFFFVETIVSRQLRRSWFDNNRLNTWQFGRLEEVLTVNKLQIWPIYIFCMEGAITILNQEIKVDCLLIAFLVTQFVIFASKASCLFTANCSSLWSWKSSYMYQHIVDRT